MPPHGHGDGRTQPVHRATGRTLLRHVLMAVRLTARTAQPSQGLAWLQKEVENFDMQHTKAIILLEYLGKQPLPHWKVDAEAARLLRGTLMNAGV
ncbi:hypothetical protein [Deinococcus cavernae]|uniref:hypothetical protein n=1 Tax=Deinococcus cavernae TaxID=2320857 RepID=UPI001F269ECB|nr:hypothetical protein [Deinococcus cavernae]